MNSKIKVLLVDDHDMFREGIRLLLSSSNQAEVIAEAVNGADFLEKMKQISPDVILMDIAMPIMDGVEATRMARELYPNSKIIALTMFGDEKYYYQMIQSGIKGFVLKSSGISELLKAISEVANGGHYFSGELLCKLIVNLSASNNEKSSDCSNELEKLSARELEVLEQVALGLSNDEIAVKLHISSATVRTHRSNLLQKTGCGNTASLILFAIKNKIIEIS